MDDQERMDIIGKMSRTVLEGEEGDAEELARIAVSEGMDLEQVMDDGFLHGIRQAGELYEAGDYYLPELVCSADAMKAALAVLDPELKKKAGGASAKGKIVIATVQGDIHDIGKTIVGAMLTASGYEVYDLGADVANDRVVQAVREISPDVLGLSALLTSTMEEQRNVIDMLEREKLRSGLKIIVGGAPASREWAKRINADGYSDNALNAVRLVKELMA